MRCNYTSAKTSNEQKKQIIQTIYNLMNISVNSIVIILKNNISAQVMNEVDIKKSLRMYSRASYNDENSEMEKFNDTLSIKN